MNLYEHTIIARQDTSPSEIKQLIEKYSKIVEKNQGEIIKTENWGLIHLSYLIKKTVKAMIEAHPYEEPAYQVWEVKTLDEL